MRVAAWVLLAACLLGPSAASAEHAVLAEEVAAPSGFRYRHVRFRSPDFEVRAVLLPPGRYRARIVDQPEPGFFTAPAISALTKTEQALVGINGGYFEPDFRPTGLLLIDGVEQFPLRRRPLLSGLVVIGADGQLELRVHDAGYAGARWALQSGPFLIDPPAPPEPGHESTATVSGTVGIRRQGPAARRTVLALSPQKELVVLSTDAVSLLDLAETLVREPQALGVAQIERALNLDGGPSTALTVRFTREPVQIEALTPVRTALVWSAVEPANKKSKPGKKPKPGLRPAASPKASSSAKAG